MVVLGQYNLLLLVIKWYWVSKVLYANIYEKNGDFVGCHRSLTHSLTHRKQNKGRLNLYKTLG